jgi:hypothetical protein
MLACVSTAFVFVLVAFALVLGANIIVKRMFKKDEKK